MRPVASVAREEPFHEAQCTLGRDHRGARSSSRPAAFRSEAEGAAAKAPRDYPVQPVPFTAVHFNDAFWAPRIEINRTVTIPFAFEKCEETERVDNFERAAAVLRGEAARGQVAARLSLRRHRRLQGDRRRLLHAERPARSEAGGVPRRPDREDRRRAGEGRLPLHHPHHRPCEPAPLGGQRALDPGEGGQPRALRPRPPLRGGRGALPGHRQADSARHRAPHRRSARPDVRPRQAVDLARPPDHRDGPREALSRHRRRALPEAREVHARRARPG